MLSKSLKIFILLAVLPLLAFTATASHVTLVLNPAFSFNLAGQLLDIDVSFFANRTAIVTQNPNVLYFDLAPGVLGMCALEEAPTRVALRATDIAYVTFARGGDQGRGAIRGYSLSDCAETAEMQYAAPPTTFTANSYPIDLAGWAPNGIAIDRTGDGAAAPQGVVANTNPGQLVVPGTGAVVALYGISLFNSTSGTTSFAVSPVSATPLEAAFCDTAAYVIHAAGAITSLDLLEFQVLQAGPVGGNPTSIAIDSSCVNGYVSDTILGSVSVIDLVSLDVTGTVDVSCGVDALTRTRMRIDYDEPSDKLLAYYPGFNLVNIVDAGTGNCDQSLRVLGGEGLGDMQVTHLLGGPGDVYLGVSDGALGSTLQVWDVDLIP